MKSSKSQKEDLKEWLNDLKFFIKKSLPTIIFIVVIFISALFLIMLIGGCNKFKLEDYVDDNPVEEFVEAIIKQQTQIDIDLTPNSPEVENGRAK